MGEGCWGPPSLAGRVSREWMSGHLWASHSRRPKGVSVTHRGPPCWGRRSCSDGRVLILTWGGGVPGPRSLQLRVSGSCVWVGSCPQGDSGADASFRPLTWQLVCCASIEQRRHVALGFAGSASALGTTHFYFPFPSFCMFQLSASDHTDGD